MAAEQDKDQQIGQISRRRFLFPLRQKSLESSETALNNALVPHFTRRVLLKAAGAVVALAAFSAKILPPLGRDVRLLTIEKDMQDFINDVPTEAQLLQKCVNLRESIRLTEIQAQNTTLYVFGDSMNLLYGKRDDKLGGDQPGSMSQIAANAVQQQEEWNWESKNFAIPGAPSGDDGYGVGVLAGRQLGNPNIQNEIVTDKNHAIAIIGLNGDDWREVVSSMEQFKNAQSLLRDPTNPINVSEFERIKARHEAVTKQFGINYGKILSKFAAISAQRVAYQQQNGLPVDPLEIIASMPMNILNLEYLPWAPLNEGPHPTPRTIYIGGPENEELRKALYQITVAIYEKANEAIASFMSKRSYKNNPHRMKITTLSMFGLEQQPNIDKNSGHLNVEGQENYADKLLAKFATQNGAEETRLQVSVQSNA